MKRGGRGGGGGEAKVLFSFGSRLRRESRSTFDSKQNSAHMNELSHTLGSAKQEEKEDLWFLFLTLLLHALQAKLIYVSVHAGLK